MIDRKKLAIIIPLDTDAGRYTLYVPDVPKERVEIAMPVLGHLFSEQERLGYSTSVMLEDSEYYIKQACKLHAMRWGGDKKEIDAIAKKIHDDFGNFMVAAFTAASVITPTYEVKQYPAVVNEIPEEWIEKAESFFAFSFAVLRYSYPKREASESAGWTSSLPASELAKHLMTSSSSAATSSTTRKASSRKR